MQEIKALSAILLRCFILADISWQKQKPNVLNIP